jgi:hypothetical protein
MDSLLGSLFGDTDNENDRRAKADDFVNRVETGDPTEGFSPQEALTSYDQVARNLSPQELEEAATQALERFSPEQRRQFADMLQSRAGVEGQVTDDPRQIAHLTSQLQSQSPNGLLGLLGGGGGLDGILGGLLGGGGGGGQSSGGGGMLNDLLGGLLGGGDDRDTTPSRSSGGSQQGGLGGIDLGNPIVQAILAAIAAIAMKKFMGRGDAPAAPAPGGGGSGGGGLTGGGWQPKEAGHRAQDTQPSQGRQPAQDAQPGGGWKPKTASHTEGDAKPQRGSGLKGADAKDA